MYKAGLCSVTFRDLSVEEVIELAVRAGLYGVEWGGDVHVPPGNEAWTAEVAYLTRQAELEVVSYGSYYHAGEPESKAGIFEQVLATAERLEAPIIRIWAGEKGSEETKPNERREIVEDIRRVAFLAAEKNISIGMEYHSDTLTDTKESAYQLINEVNHFNVHLYWQPEVGQSVDQRLQSIDKIKPWIQNLHVFQWTSYQRLPLSEGTTEWEKYLKEVGQDGKDRYALLEFVKDDSPESFLTDAITLRDVLKGLNN